MGYRVDQKQKADWPAILTLAAPAFLGLLASTRWYIRVFHYSAGIVDKGIQFSQSALTFDRDQIDYLKYILGPNASYLLMGLAVLGLFYMFIKRDWLQFGLWSIVVGFFSIPTGIVVFSFRSDYFDLVLFIVISVVSAFFAVSFLHSLTKKIEKSICSFADFVFAYWFD